MNDQELLDALPACFCCNEISFLDEIIERHGTLQEFTFKVIHAANNLVINDAEAARAIIKYKKQLANAMSKNNDHKTAH